MTIKGVSIKVSVEFGLEELTIDKEDVKAIAKAEVLSEKMCMIRRCGSNVVDELPRESKETLGKVLVDTIAKELGSAVKEQLGNE